MGTGHIQRGRRETAPIDHEAPEVFLTAGDLARLLAVDLKTIHNWVKQGQIVAHRTLGRHLRFQRVQVVRFLRRTGRPVPREIGRAPARVLVHTAPGKPRRISDGATVTLAPGLFPAALEAGSGDYEVMVLELDRDKPTLTRELVGALRERPKTRPLAIIGLSQSARRRHEFLACGGDIALSSAATGLVGAIRWLTGGASELPRGVTMTAPSSGRSSSVRARHRRGPV